MKNNQMMSILAGALLLSTLATAGMVYLWDSYYRHMRVLEPNLAEMHNLSTAMQQLYGEAAEYAKTTGSKEMTTLLTGGPTAPAAPAKPAGK
jgi:type II secretory pathway component PulM